MKQGEIWLINLDPTVGAEIKKTRSAVIINHNALGKLPLKIIVPVTEWKERYSMAPWMVKIDGGSGSGLSKASSIDCFQIRSVAEGRLLRKIGEVDVDIMTKIQTALTKVLAIEL